MDRTQKFVKHYKTEKILYLLKQNLQQDEHLKNHKRKYLFYFFR